MNRIPRTVARTALSLAAMPMFLMCGGGGGGVPSGEVINPPLRAGAFCRVPTRAAELPDRHASCKIAASCKGIKTVYGKFNERNVILSWSPTKEC